jgi:hypothetical protein
MRLRLGFAAWLFGMFCYFLPAATWSPVSRFDLTRSLVEQHRVTIDAFADNTGDRAKVGEHWFSDKAPFVAAFAAPAYQIYHLFDRARGKSPSYELHGPSSQPAARVSVNRSFQRGLYVCSLSTAALSGVALGLLLFEALRRRMSVVPALWGAALGVLATPIFPYSTSFYGHVVAGAFLVAGSVLLDPEDPACDGGPSFSRALCAGACLAASVGCEYLAAVPALALGLGLLWGRSRGAWPRLGLGLVLGGGGVALALGLYHWSCFGAPWRTGYSFIVDPLFAKGHASGILGVRLPRWNALWGLLFGRLRGLFYVAPVALLLAWGLVARARAGDTLARAGVCAAASLLFVNASYYMWWGGAAAAPRHLVPILGFLAFGLPWLHGRRWARYVLVVLGAVSAVNMLAIAAVGLEAPERGDVLLDFVYARLLEGRLSALSGASNLGLEFGLVRGGTLGPLLAWALVGAYILHRQVSDMSRPRDRDPSLELEPIGT